MESPGFSLPIFEKKPPFGGSGNLLPGGGGNHAKDSPNTYCVAAVNGLRKPEDNGP
jgi:hypothetical protein